MKIIVPGKNQKDWRATVTCTEEYANGCNAVFEIERSDAFVAIKRLFAHSNPTVYCLCPNCGIQVLVCDARPYLMDLPSLEAFTAKNPAVVTKAVGDQVRASDAYAAYPRDEGC